MLRKFLVLATITAIWAVSGLPAHADTVPIDDPLHGYCAPAATQCIDNGANSPTSHNPPSNFGFTVSPGPASGDLVLDILVPNNEDSSPSTLHFGITGTIAGTANLFSTTAWSSGSLAPFLGIAASPNNPIGAYLPATQALDASATGFFVYQVDLGATTLLGPSNPNIGPLENISSGVLPQASYIVGFLNEGTVISPDWIATANSGAIFETGTPTPEPGSLALFGTGLLTLGALIRRKLLV